MKQYSQQPCARSMMICRWRAPIRDLGITRRVDAQIFHKDADRHIAKLRELGQSLQAFDIVLLDLIKCLK